MYLKSVKNVNVVQAAEQRILKIFQENKRVVLYFSGGKDSLCLSDMVVNTMLKYNIDFARLNVIFFDEEAIYPDCEKLALDWRQKFLSLGAKFYWFCLPIKHFNCCNKLASDESFICWEPGKEDSWVRPMPKFAIRYHKKFRMGMTYQKFAACLTTSMARMVGLRIAESVQRRSAIGKRTGDKMTYPIYDWKDVDVWLYIKRHDLEFPMTYIYMYKCGVPFNRLRISQFFSIDTIKILPKVLEFYPDLYQRIIKREPNADLVMLYWDTDMFRSSQQNNAFGIKEDYRKLLDTEMKKAFQFPDDYPGFKQAKRLYSKLQEYHTEKCRKQIYQILIAGDPKGRSFRSTNLLMIKEELAYGNVQ